MTYIEQLLNGENVEWKKLGEVCKRTKGTKITAKEMNNIHKEDGTIKIFAGGKTYAYVNVEDIPNQDICHIPSIIVKSRGIIGFEYYDKPFSHKSEMWAYHSDDLSADIKFIYYYLVNHEYYFQRLGSKMQMPQISIPDTDRFLIPLPPLSVQHKIVEILDKFTELEANLEAELDCRKRQYEYYRNQLLSFDMLNRGGQKLNDVKIMTLGEIGTFVRGSGLQKKDLTTQGIPAIHYGQIYTYYGTYAKKTKSFVSQEFALKARKAKHGDLIIATTSENDEDVCKAVAWLGDEDIAVSNDACFYDHTMNPKYIAYYFQTELFQSQKRKFITGTKVRRVNAKDLAKIKIPLPPLSVQREIVEILDKFDTLCNSISEGLPKEIELRRKQYEYYRNQLLTLAQ